MTLIQGGRCGFVVGANIGHEPSQKYFTRHFQSELIGLHRRWKTPQYLPRDTIHSTRTRICLLKVEPLLKERSICYMKPRKLHHIEQWILLRIQNRIELVWVTGIRNLLALPTFRNLKNPTPLNARLLGLVEAWSKQSFPVWSFLRNPS